MTSEHNTDKPIAFIDLGAQRRYLGDRIDSAISRVLEHGKYILGPEVQNLEKKLSEYVGCKHSIACANGTDALQLVLMAQGVCAGDAVFVPSFTFTSTAEVVALVGATPVFIDIDEHSFNMDPASLRAAIEMVQNDTDLKPKAVISVDLFGQPADYAALDAIAQENDLWLMVDGAQSFGATLHGEQSCSKGFAATTSFFPAKPLGCYGDGGAIFTDDDELASVIRSLRVHGKGTDKYDNVRVGINSRLDAMQAAILLEKIDIFPEEIQKREAVAQGYIESLRGLVELPVIQDGAQSVWAQFTFKTSVRDELSAALKKVGVPTAVYYPKPLHQQTAYKGCLVTPGGLPVSERLAGEVLSLPMHPYLEPEVQKRITTAVKEALNELGTKA